MDGAARRQDPCRRAHRRRRGVRFSIGRKAAGSDLDAAFRDRVGLSLDQRAAAARAPLSRLQFDFHSARLSTARGMEILRSGLVSCWAAAYEAVDLGLFVRARPWF